MRYIIYCDESDDKGEFYSNFYGGALLRAHEKPEIEERLTAAKGDGFGVKEFKWTKITPYAESNYARFAEEIFTLCREGKLKLRIMFTQNINQTLGIEYDQENEYFMLYYQFLKHAFGLQFCNGAPDEHSHVAIALDDVPGPIDEFNNFREYISSLTRYPLFFNSHISIPKDDIFAVDSKLHVILQAVDVVLGAMQFRLNGKHLRKPDGAWRRAKRTLAKERIYKGINRQIREIYPNFNIGVSTGEAEQTDRWKHPYAHWLFVPAGSVKDLSRGKKKTAAKKG